MSTFKLPHIRKRSCRPYPESGAETVEYVIAVLVAIVIGLIQLTTMQSVNDVQAEAGD